ncbi:hypothetical protein GQ53DRAFT_818091 [Thozetella sp. PMI_491]|nr:hypothetical protein GQ53DRAFT_818091 [Thozetella sp. PMI_491]
MPLKTPKPRTTRNSRGLRVPCTPTTPRAVPVKKNVKKKVTFELGSPVAKPTYPLYKEAEQEDDDDSYISAVKRSNRNRNIIQNRQEREDDKAGLSGSRRFRAIQTREGQSFARGLYIAILNDHVMRECECRTPIIYDDETAAKNGKGRLRFYRIPFASEPRSIGVLTVLSDPLWHCQCTAPYRPAYLPIIAKRSADDAKLEQIDSDLDEAARLKEQESNDENNSASGHVRHRTKRQKFEGAFHSITQGIAVMSKSIFQATIGAVGKTFSAIAGTYSTIVETVQHTRQHGIQPTVPVPTVQRLKRQVCLPPGTSPEIRLDEDARYNWAPPDDFSHHIGRPLLLAIMAALESQKVRLEQDLAAWRETVEELKTTFDPPRPHVDLYLSICIHNLMQDHYGESTYENFLLSIEAYKAIIAQTLSFMHYFYLDKELYKIYVSQYPSPPSTIEYRPWRDHKRNQIREIGDFLAWLLKQKDAFTFDPDVEEALAKIVVDANAITKNEIAPSMVTYTGQESLGPGTYPDQLIYDEIPIHSLSIKPSYDERFPGNEDERDKLTVPGPRFRPMIKPKSILKKTSKEWSENEASPAYVATPLKKRKLAFDSPLAAFDAPQHIPMIHSEPERSKTGILKESKEYPADPGSPDYDHASLREPMVFFSNATNKIHEVARYQYPKRKAKLIPFGYKTWRKEIEDDDKYALRVYDERFGRLLDQLRQEIRHEPNAPWVRDHVSKVLQHPLQERIIPYKELFPIPDDGEDEDQKVEETKTAILEAAQAAPAAPAALATPTKPKSEAEMERRLRMVLFLHDLKLNDKGKVVWRDPKHLQVEFDQQVIDATRGVEDPDAIERVRQDLFAEKEKILHHFQAEVDAIRRQRELEEEEARKKRQEEIERLERLERERLEELERLERERLEELERERLRREEEERLARKAEELEKWRVLRQPRNVIVTALDDEWDAKVDEISTKDYHTVQAQSLDGTGLTRRDFEMLLHPQGWLNDNSIIGGVLAVAEYVNRVAGAPKDSPKCAAFNSYFYPRILSHGPASLDRLMKRAKVSAENFLSIDTILVPICRGNHWTLAVVRPTCRTITHIDSMRGGGGDETVVNNLRDWVSATLADQFVEADWDAARYECPLQTNGWDCGVFTITNAVCLALGVKPIAAYGAEQLTLQRRRLAAVLLNGGFSGNFSLDYVVEG